MSNFKININEKLKSRIKEKFKNLQYIKINHLNKNNFINTENKFPKKNIKNIYTYELYFSKKLYLKYNTLPQQYNLIQINNIIKGKYCHSFYHLKESLIFNHQKEFLKKYYTKTNSIKLIKNFSEYYKIYLQFFCSPTLNEINLNELLEEVVEKKAMFFYKKNYKEENDKKNKDNKNYINMIVFTNKIRKDISRKNTLKDLSKATIGFNSMSHNTNTNSYKSLNSLINEIGDNKKDIINVNKKNIKNNKNVLFSDRNIKNYTLNKKINISRQKSNNNNINKNNNNKPTNHKINIVNNKIVIINNNSKTRENILKQNIKNSTSKKKQKKNNITLLSRNSYNNINFNLFNEVANDLIKSQDKIIKTVINNPSPIAKILNNQRKFSFKISNNNIKNKNKISIRIIRIYFFIIIKNFLKILWF